MLIRRSSERGHADHGWLDTYHTFSFASYYDPQHMGFGPLRVINEDKVKPGRGFPTHPHDNMEILTYVLEGELQHKDSMGTGSVIRPGEVQRMSAGTGVTHSEVNSSKDTTLHLLQIWIVPDVRGLKPSYEQKAFPASERQGKLRLVASRDGREGSVSLHQDVSLHAGLLAPSDAVSYTLPAGRKAWLHVARGAADVNGASLQAGDSAAFTESGPIALSAREASEVLLFDLP